MNERVENCTLNRNWIWTGKEYLDINTWNEAIEQAAKWLETANRNDTNDAQEIRKLKK